MIARAVRLMTVGYRLLAVAGVLVVVAGIAILVVACPSATVRRRIARIGLTRCSRALLAALGLARVARGPMPPRGSLLVANHLSWLDVPAALAFWPCTFVAKREVRAWPLLSTLGDALGVVWIDRSRPRDLLRVIPTLEQTLRTGHSVLLFPEGTTTNGRTLLPFRSGLLEAAVRAQALVFPVAISCHVESGEADALCWYGDETLVANLPRVASLRGARVSLHVGAPIAVGHDRKTLARMARQQLVRRFRRMSHGVATLPPIYAASARAKQNFRPIDSSDREILV